ncbi:hypothetical protein Mapa_016694 [Marchantia paleacea]|nr:hypothetical protein Mapa_016694 [Marchantia paleacea]
MYSSIWSCPVLFEIPLCAVYRLEVTFESDVKMVKADLGSQLFWSFWDARKTNV